MQRARAALLFSLLMLAVSDEGFAQITFSDVLGYTQREPYALILLGTVLIAGAMGLRYLIMRKRKDSSR